MFAKCTVHTVSRLWESIIETNETSAEECPGCHALNQQNGIV